MSNDNKVQAEIKKLKEEVKAKEKLAENLKSQNTVLVEDKKNLEVYNGKLKEQVKELKGEERKHVVIDDLVEGRKTKELDQKQKDMRKKAVEDAKKKDNQDK